MLRLRHTLPLLFTVWWLSCQPGKEGPRRQVRTAPPSPVPRPEKATLGALCVGPAELTAVASSRWEREHFQIYTMTFEGRLGSDGGFVVPPRYHEVWRVSPKGLPPWFHVINGRFWTLNEVWGGRHGYLDARGNPLIPVEHEDLAVPAGGRIRFLRDGKTGYLDLQGHVVIPPRFAGGHEFSEGRACVNVGGRLRGAPTLEAHVAGGKWGYIDADGQWTRTPAVDHCDPYSGGFATVQIGCHDMVVNCCDHVCTGGKWGLLDLQGRWTVPPEYDQLEELAPGHFLFCKASCRAASCRQACGLTGPDGGIRVELTSDLAKFERLKDQHLKHAAKKAPTPPPQPIGDDDDYGYYGGCNRYDPTFPVRGPRGSRCETVDRSPDGRVSCRDAGGTTLELPGVDWVGEFNGRSAPVRVRGRWGFMNADGRRFVEPVLAARRVFHRLCHVRLDRDARGRALFFYQTHGETGTLTLEGAYQADPPAQEAVAGDDPEPEPPAEPDPDDPPLDEKERDYFRRNALFPVNFLWPFGYRPLFQMESDEPTGANDLRRAEMERVWEFLKTCDDWESHDSDQFLVVKGGKAGLIDSNGRFLIPMEYEKLTYWREDLWIAKKNRKVGLIGPSGRVVLPLVHTEILPIGPHLLRVTRDGRMGLVNAKGAAIVPLKYQELRALGEGLLGLCEAGCADLGKASWQLKRLDSFVELPGAFSALEAAPDGHILFAAPCGAPDKPCVANRFGVLSPEGTVLFPDGAAEKDVTTSFSVKRIGGTSSQVRIVHDATGETKGPVFDHALPFFAGTHWVNTGCILTPRDRGEPTCEGGKWGLFSPTLGMLTPMAYDAVFERHGPWTAVGVSCLFRDQQTTCERMALVDFTGKTVIAPKYRRFDFEGGDTFVGQDPEVYVCRRPGLVQGGTIAVVDDAGRMGLVDTRGKILIPAEYDKVCTPQDGVARVMRRDPSDPDRSFGAWGLVGLDGRILLPANYGYISSFRDGVARINEGGHCMPLSWLRCRGGRWGLVKPTGEFLATPRFDWIEPFVGRTARTLVRPRFGLLRVTD